MRAHVVGGVEDAVDVRDEDAPRTELDAGHLAGRQLFGAERLHEFVTHGRDDTRGRTSDPQPVISCILELWVRQGS